MRLIKRFIAIVFIYITDSLFSFKKCKFWDNLKIISDRLSTDLMKKSSLVGCSVNTNEPRRLLQLC